MMRVLYIGSIAQVVIIATLFKIHFTITLCYFTFYIYILHFIFWYTVSFKKCKRDLVILDVANCIL